VEYRRDVGDESIAAILHRPLYQIPGDYFQASGERRWGALRDWGPAQRHLEGYDNRVAKSTDFLSVNWSICEGIHDKMAVRLVRTDKVSDNPQSSDRKSLLDPEF